MPKVATAVSSSTRASAKPSGAPATMSDAAPATATTQPRAPTPRATHPTAKRPAVFYKRGERVDPGAVKGSKTVGGIEDNSSYPDLSPSELVAAAGLAHLIHDMKSWTSPPAEDGYYKTSNNVTTGGASSVDADSTGKSRPSP